MYLDRAQADVRAIYSGGWGGPAVSALVWLASGLSATRVGIGVAAVVLFLGGFLIFPIGLVMNRVQSGQSDLPPGHPMRGLAMQLAMGMALILLPLCLMAPRIESAFFPLAMIVVGAHYLPFTHLYGKRGFVILGSVICLAGFVLLMTRAPVASGAYVMSALLALSSAALYVWHRRRRGEASA